MQRRMIPWAFFSISTFCFLWVILNGRFREIKDWRMVVGAGITLGIAFSTVRWLRRKDAVASPVEDQNDFPIRTHADLAACVESMCVYFKDLPCDADDARTVIEKKIRTRYQAIVRAFLAQSDLGGARRVEIQMALGDFMVHAERVWSMLADGATGSAAATWEAARNPSRLERIQSLLSI